MLQTRIYRRRFHDVNKRNNLWRVLTRDFFQQYISRNHIVLEIACGYGEFINSTKCKKKIAVDINPESRKYLNKSIQFIKAYSDNIPLQNNSVDVIFISNFFEHISKDAIVRTIQEARRILRPEGKILILQPNIRFCQNDYWMFFDHITPIDDRALLEIFSAYGFVCTKRIERFLPYTTKSRLPQWDIVVRLYLRFPILWYLFGKQSFLIFQK